MPNPIRTKIYETYLKAIGVKNPDELYRRIWSEGERGHSLGRHLVGHLPKNPRCTLCNAPFRGFGAPLMRLLGKPPSTRNPRFCAACEDFMTRHQGGAEVELTMLFADVRGSTTLAEQMSASDYSRLMKRFYLVATEVLVNTDALIERLVGDEVVGLFIPGYAGPEHARQAVQAAQELLYVTGHRDPGGAWLPIGVGFTRALPTSVRLKGRGAPALISPRWATMSTLRRAYHPRMQLARSSSVTPLTPPLNLISATWNNVNWN
jgi:hypothetical protein